MFGTRNELCLELERMFTSDEPLALIFWTEEGVRAVCQGLSPTDEEIAAVQETIGNMDMKICHRDGVTGQSVQELLVRHREGINRHVCVPVQVLSRLVLDIERELIHQEGLAWVAGGPVPQRISQGLDDVEVLKALLAA